jgi:anti-sigma factor RsiW
MRELREEAGDDLDALALLYADGEMNPRDAAAFERLLGEDQRAREALALAVELARTLDGLPTPTPHPEYRERVRRRLQPQAVGARLTARRYRRHTAFWAALGAAAVLLAVAAAEVWQMPPPSRQPDRVQVTPASPETALDETALLWSELPKHEGLARLREEEQRHKTRFEDVRVVRNEERPDRFAPAPMPHP